MPKWNPHCDVFRMGDAVVEDDGVWRLATVRLEPSTESDVRSSISCLPHPGFKTEIVSKADQRSRWAWLAWDI
jgi:hypothetical protein